MGAERDFLLERRVVGLKAPGDKGGEPAGLVLKPPDALQMLDHVLGLLDVPAHHGGGRSDTEAVSRAVHFQPLLVAALFWADPFSDPFRKDLGPSAGQGNLSGFL